MPNPQMTDLRLLHHTTRREHTRQPSVPHVCHWRAYFTTYMHHSQFPGLEEPWDMTKERLLPNPNESEYMATVNMYPHPIHLFTQLPKETPCIRLQLLEQRFFPFLRRLRDSDKRPFIGLAYCTPGRHFSSLEVLPDVPRHAQIGRADHAVAF